MFKIIAFVCLVAVAMAAPKAEPKADPKANPKAKPDFLLTPYGGALSTFAYPATAAAPLAYTAAASPVAYTAATYPAVHSVAPIAAAPIATAVHGVSPVTAAVRFHNVASPVATAYHTAPAFSPSAYVRANYPYSHYPYSAYSAYSAYPTYPAVTYAGHHAGYAHTLAATPYAAFTHAF